MTDFVFLYRGSELPASPEQRQEILQLWMVWMKSLGEGGHLIDRGQALERSGRIVRAGKAITDGPFTETKEVVGGFTLIRAKDLAEAAELARGCPILARGGEVEVRPVMTLD